MDDLERVLQDAHSHQLLSIVPPVHHERVGHPLHDGALRLPEALGCVPASTVGQELGILLLNRQVIL